MNPLIEIQLNKLRDNFDIQYEDGTTQLNIPRKSSDSSVSELVIDCCYLISVEDYILYPPEGFTLHSNWNSNKIPVDKIMKIDVLNRMGKMIKVNSIGYDMKNHKNTGNVWIGWLPEESIKIIERL